MFWKVRRWTLLWALVKYPSGFSTSPSSSLVFLSPSILWIANLAFMDPDAGKGILWITDLKPLIMGTAHTHSLCEPLGVLRSRSSVMVIPPRPFAPWTLPTQPLVFCSHSPDYLL